MWQKLAHLQGKKQKLSETQWKATYPISAWINMLLVREQRCSAFHKHVIKISITHLLIGLQSLFISCSCFHCCDCRYWVTFTEREHYHNIVNSFLIGKKWSVTVLQHQATASLITFFSLGFTRGRCTPPSTVMHNYSFNMMPHKDDLERWRIWWKALNRN